MLGVTICNCWVYCFQHKRHQNS